MCVSFLDSWLVSPPVLGYLMGPPAANERWNEGGRRNGALRTIRPEGLEAFQRSAETARVANNLAWDPTRWSGDVRERGVREEMVPRFLSTRRLFFQRQNTTDPPCRLAQPLTTEQRAAGSVDNGRLSVGPGLGIRGRQEPHLAPWTMLQYFLFAVAAEILRTAGMSRFCMRVSQPSGCMRRMGVSMSPWTAQHHRTKQHQNTPSQTKPLYGSDHDPQ
ncbi:predicted protein [Chaetomium globosum CBS 148.51]|uniref:Uncharacterized protein n=1 Tax=Chaetomium globosum (strain ATCC 6205 / CBS 148.51 / DSM 1962 / NBRC 6347 / NRRL 1970) TaxID=306901 RepID=Q2HFD6_CHAGB|nr:uncharacterized protein CHGG_01068 [Chaetomium globosum CBS 148.51]EAQ92833.1 predicted protein [Chaetomium globosum CBS 148.51]